MGTSLAPQIESAVAHQEMFPNAGDRPPIGILRATTRATGLERAKLGNGNTLFSAKEAT